MRFMCCLNMGFNLTILKMSPDLFSDILQESAAAWTDHYVDIFVHNNVTRVMTFQRHYDIRIDTFILA